MAACIKTASRVPSRTLLWFRDADLRLTDNPLVCRVGELKVPCLPIYVTSNDHGCVSPQGFPKFGARRVRFIEECLGDLRDKLRGLGSGLLVLRGDPSTTIAELLKSHKPHADHTLIVVSEEPCTEEQGQVAALRRGLQHLQEAEGISAEVQCIWHRTLYHPQDLPKGCTIENMPDTFTPWRKKVESANTPIRPLLPTPLSMPPLWETFSSEAESLQRPIRLVPLNSADSIALDSDSVIVQDPRGAMGDTPMHKFVGGETAAWQRVREWIWDQDMLKDYFEVRNGLIGSQYSSKLSPYLAHGCISARSIYAERVRYEKERVANKSTYWLVFELLVRDYFQFQAAKQGWKLFRLGGPSNKSVAWPGSRNELERWTEGKTGWSIVDANMLELKLSGFMSNRGRQIVASFLVHELKCDWRAGAEYFESALLDYDCASNYGNWATVTGLFGGRVNRFNIMKQAWEYDKDGNHVRRWIPELLKVPANKIHCPWEMTKEEMEKSGLDGTGIYANPLPSRWEAKVMKKSHVREEQRNSGQAKVNSVGRGRGRGGGRGRERERGKAKAKAVAEREGGLAGEVRKGDEASSSRGVKESQSGGKKERRRYHYKDIEKRLASNPSEPK